jgi:hypothetical protein
MDNTLEGVDPTLKGLYDQTQEQIERLRAEFEGADANDAARRDALNHLLILRERLESASEANEESEMVAYDALYAISSAIEDLELNWTLELPELPDMIKEGTRGAPSLLAGDTLWERLAEFVERSVPWREVTMAMSEIMDMEAAGDEPEDDQEAAFMEAALAMARDFLVHDWRWHEGKGVLSRFRKLSPGLSDEEKSATEVMERSHYDLYRVDDVDRDRGRVTLTRLHDGEEISVEVFEDVLDVLDEGDGLLARVYVWADGAELGAFLPVDPPTLDQLEADMNDLLGTDMGPPETGNRATKLKVHGYLVVSDLLFPEDDDEDDDHEGHDHGAEQ